MSDFNSVHDGFHVAYSHAIATGQTPNDRVIWPNRMKQYARFEEISSFLDLTDTRLSILDLGCGNGEYVGYLERRAFAGTYKGIDLHEGMIDEARERFPGYDFEQCDVLSASAPPADVVIMSGVFNVAAGQTLDYVRAVLAASVRCARRAVIFNAITTHVDFRDAETFYLEPAAAVDIAAAFSRRFTLKHGTPPFNMTICIFVE